MSSRSTAYRKSRDEVSRIYRSLGINTERSRSPLHAVDAHVDMGMRMYEDNTLDMVAPSTIISRDETTRDCSLIGINPVQSRSPLQTAEADENIGMYDDNAPEIGSTPTSNIYAENEHNLNHIVNSKKYVSAPDIVTPSTSTSHDELTRAYSYIGIHPECSSSALQAADADENMGMCDDYAPEIGNPPSSSIHDENEHHMDQIMNPTDHDRFENEDEDEDEDVHENHVEMIDIAQKMVSWHIQYNISENATDDLLLWLKENHFPHLPRHIKTLKASAKLTDVSIHRMDDGQFCYFGLKKMLLHILQKNEAGIPSNDNCELQFGIDGIPLTKSSRSTFWPILVKIKEFPDVLPVAVYHGPGKPRDVHEYMQEFIVELDIVTRDGLQLANKRISISVSAFIMDAQAKSFVLNIKAANGFYGCPKCTTHGYSIGHRTVFPNLGCSLRTDASFLDLSDGHHSSNILPPLATINIGCISAVPIDYMHNVLLGVFRTLLKLWTETTNKSYSLNETQKAEIDNRLKTLNKQMCADFTRKPRPLKDLKFFKATELRLILLYLGPFIFLNVVQSSYYNNFLKLHSAIRLLCHPTLYRTENDTARNLLEAFALEFQLLYSEHLFVYNFHVITHLASECLLHGPLDAFSAFPFENYLQMILHYIKKAPYPLQQLKNRMGEHMQFEQKHKKKVIRKREDSYMAITNDKNSLISTEPRDNFIRIDNKVYKVRRIRKNRTYFVLSCNQVLNLTALYIEPFDSKVGGLFCCEQLSLDTENVDFNADDVDKVLCIKLDGIFGLIVVLHTNTDA